MRRKDKLMWIKSSTILALFFLSAGIAIGMRLVHKESTLFLFYNLMISASALCALLTVIALQKHLNPITMILLLINPLLSFGQLYFLENRFYHQLLICLFLVAIVYCAGYLFYALVIQKRKIEVQNIWLINAFLPIFFIVGTVFIKSIFSLELTFNNTKIIIMPIFFFSLGASAMALIPACILIKDRRDKKEFFWKMVAVFFFTLAITFLIPVLSAQYVNYTFDPSAGEEVQCIVTDKHTHSGGRGLTRYCLMLEVNGEEIEFTTHRVIYANYEKGETFTLYTHQGALGYPYYEYQLDTLFRYDETES